MKKLDLRNSCIWVKPARKGFNLKCLANNSASIYFVSPRAAMAMNNGLRSFSSKFMNSFRSLSSNPVAREFHSSGSSTTLTMMSSPKNGIVSINEDAENPPVPEELHPNSTQHHGPITFVYNRALGDVVGPLRCRSMWRKSRYYHPCASGFDSYSSTATQCRHWRSSRVAVSRAFGAKSSGGGAHYVATASDGGGVHLMVEKA
ncbi:hypothetical protein Cgig2_027260 [Carnegiea gigantea]|uniref:Uncharacterized protein n=1 Tax=Carnegiea gigantea TaxID=171969 RepID=A0A9Q1GTZ9_9CARY|nr:hypothetical protein Cgig2_027260 [Carnegiea gigantea]